MKIMFIIKASLEFYSSILNILFFISVIFYFFYVKLNKKNPENIQEFSNVIKIIWDFSIFLMIFLPFVYIIFFKIKLKYCFLGSCLLDADLNFHLQIIPFLIEAFILVLIFMNFFVFYYLKINEINQQEILFEKELLENNENYNEETRKVIKGEKESFLLSFGKVLIFEFIYMLIVGGDALMKFHKYKAFNLSRYENYCSIHDYLIIFKGFLVFFCLTVNKENYKEWKKAFDNYDDEYFEETRVDQIVENIIIIKNKAPAPASNLGTNVNVNNLNSNVILNQK